MSLKLEIISKNKNIVNGLIASYQSKINKIYHDIDQGTATWSKEWMGWRKLANGYDQSLIDKMVGQAKKWQQLKIKHVVVIGIGGSCLGARACINMCHNLCNDVTFHWIHNIHQDYLQSKINLLKKEAFGIIVISKSGTTLEPAIGLKLFLDLLKKNVKKDMNKYVVAITDANKGVLLTQAKENNWFTLAVPDDIGGRFSMFSPVGMFIMIYSGIDYKQILAGCKQAYKDTLSSDMKKNSAALYAAFRNNAFNSKAQFENLIFYNPSLMDLGEQWKQMFCESQGKDGKGLFEACSLFTTDLHSLGQYFQDGPRNFFETTIWVKNYDNDQTLSYAKDPNFSYLDKKTVGFINQSAFKGTIGAHTDLGNVDNLIINLDKQDEYHYAYLTIWVAMTVTIEAYLLGVNPFNQPGVEAYKKQMMDLIKKK